MRTGLVTGVNVDAINVDAGLRELVACGYPATEIERHYVVQHALMRWARGEEPQAERGAIDKNFHGIDLTSWRRCLAAAMAGATVRHRPVNDTGGPNDDAVIRCSKCGKYLATKQDDSICPVPK